MWAIAEIEKNDEPLFIDILTDEPGSILKNVQLGFCDLGIIYDNEPFRYPDLTYYPLFLIERIFVCSFLQCVARFLSEIYPCSYASAERFLILFPIL